MLEGIIMGAKFHQEDYTVQALSKTLKAALKLKWLRGLKPTTARQ
jgi:hypothetical protein